jgi:hypothetical protein
LSLLVEKLGCVNVKISRGGDNLAILWSFTT